MTKANDPKTVFHSDTPSTDKIIEVKDTEESSAAEVLEETTVNTTNDFGLGMQLGIVRPIAYPEFRTKQQGYRFAAWLFNMVELLDSESPDHTFDEINEAIRNS